MNSRVLALCVLCFLLLITPVQADDQYAAQLLGESITALKDNDFATAGRLAEESWAEASPGVPFRETILSVLMASYQQLKEDEKIEQYGELALDALQEGTPLYKEKKVAYLDLLAIIALKKSDYKRCMSYYNRMLPALESLPPEVTEARGGTYANMGLCFLQGEDTPKARHLYQKSLAILKQVPGSNPERMAQIEHNIEFLDNLSNKNAIAFLPTAREHFNAAEEAFKKSDKVTALNEYQKALDLTVKTQGAESGASLTIQRRIKEAQSIESTNDYLHLVAFPVSRWRTKTVVVYIEDGSKLAHWRPELPDLMKKALEQWQFALNNKVVFEYTTNHREYDVKISWVNGCIDNKAESKDPNVCVGGLNSRQTWDRYLAQNDILISVNKNNSETHSLESIYSIMLHESGHMMGLKGHSNNPSDIMFSYTQDDWDPRMGISTRDLSTIVALYEIKPRITNPKRYRLSRFDDFKSTVSATYMLDSGPLVSFEDDEDDLREIDDSSPGDKSKRKKRKKRRKPYNNHAPIWINVPGPGY